MTLRRLSVRPLTKALVARGLKPMSRELTSWRCGNR